MVKFWLFKDQQVMEKTTLIKNGVAKALKRPFGFIALGGAQDSSFLEGFDYTYEGSKCGKNNRYS